MLRRSNAYLDLWNRKKFSGPLDIRAPEDYLVAEQEHVRTQPIWPSAIGAAIGEFNLAMRSGLEEDLKRSAKGVVDATSAYFRISGVPTFAHDPVPPQLIKEALRVEHLASGEHTKQAVGRFVDVFDDSVKPMLRVQIAKLLEDDAASAARGLVAPERGLAELSRILGAVAGGSPGNHAGSEPERPTGGRLSPTGSHTKFADFGYVANYPPEAVESIDDTDARDAERSPRRRDGITQYATLADDLPGRSFVEERPRYAVIEGQGRAEPLVAPVVMWAVRKYGVPALIGGALSVLAEYVANGDKAEPLDYVSAFLTGAASGAVDKKRGKAAFEALLAMGGSIAEDIARDEPVSITRAVGAALAAYVVTQVSGRIPGGAQAGSRAARKFAEKYMQRFIKEVFGIDVNFTTEDLEEIWEGFERRFKDELNRYPGNDQLPMPVSLTA